MTETKTDTQQQQMLRGTAWMTASNIISRLLGALYIIPWYAWMGKQGDQANALFGQGYNIYALFLLISTAGIPVAIAKQVSKYNTLGKKNGDEFLLTQAYLVLHDWSRTDLWRFHVLCFAVDVLPFWGRRGSGSRNA